MRNRIVITLILLAVIPTLLLGISSIISGMNSVKQCSEAEEFKNLDGICHHLRDEFTDRYSGPYVIKNDHYYANNLDVSLFVMNMEKFKQEFNCEVTIFFGDTRAVTTITDSRGKRITGTKQNDPRVIEAIKNGKTFSNSGIEINGSPYYGVYIPLYNKSEIEGMVFAGVSKEYMQSVTAKFYRQNIITFIVILVLAIIVVAFCAKRLGSMLAEIKSYLGKLTVESGENAQISARLLKRRDDIGELARYSVTVGEQLRSIIDRDSLTGLYNRRSGRYLLDSLHSRSVNDGSAYTLVMCDIDYFKNVNDKYGHDIGDNVLKRIYSIVLDCSGDCQNSFVIRWGGEEALMGFPLGKRETLDIVRNIRQRIKEEIFESNSGEKFSITMTYGVESSEGHQDVHSVIVCADENMYKGKKSGRDIIVS